MVISDIDLKKPVNILMLFNSYPFVFYFLPLTVILFYFLAHKGCRELAIGSLVLASLFFYAWWNPAYLLLLGASILVNYWLGQMLYKRPIKTGLVIGVGFNLALLGYFKYANFFVDNLNSTLATSIHLETIVLPLAISFFTFQQVAYLVDCYRRETEEHLFIHYCLFVTFFPQLIAGPIVHHKEMLPQFANNATWKFSFDNLSVGMTIFIIGLIKKVILADGVAEFSNPVFTAAENGEILHPLDAWGGALAYTLQLYFDFSGYADMAVGSAKIFGINLPLNFNSPYKSCSIIDFWRRWHMTLSRFLRDYVYIALGGNRKGKARRHVNLLATMLLGGLWHGAGWNFVIWGGLHGFYLVINHLWHVVRRTFGMPAKTNSIVGKGLAWLLTFLAVVVAWVFFRAETLLGAELMLGSMLGFVDTNTMDAPVLLDDLAAKWIGALLLIVWLMPNSQQFMGLTQEGEMQTTWLSWRPTVGLSLVFTVAFIYTLARMTEVSEFLYFQF